MDVMTTDAATATTAWTRELPPHTHVPRPYDGLPREELVAMRKQFTNPAVYTYYREPLLIVEGNMQYLYDETGRRYLDLLAGIVTISIGHCHPKFVERVSQQVNTLQHATSIYLHPNFPLLAKKLASKMPAGLDVTYFTNSGSEANDLAIQMARLYTGHHDVIALRNSYHGGSPGAIGLTSHSTWKYPVHGGGGVHHAVSPDPYRSAFDGTPEEIASKSAAEIRELVRFSTPGKIAAFVAESMQGVGGVTYGASNYLKEAYAITREYGGLCIADEVQTGFGRTGDHYWGFQNWGVVPEFVTMAKGLGNGAPIGAVTTRMDIAKTLTQRIHFNTYANNPVSMAAGLAVLDIIDEDGLQENCRALGARFLKGLHKLQAAYPLIGDVRGKGLMLGIELVRDRATKTAARQETLDMLEALREMHVLLGKGGIDGNVLRIKPPMCITAADVDYSLEALDAAFAKVGAR